MFLMWIIPLVLLGLIVYTILGNNLAAIFKPVTNSACPKCTQAVQNDWKICPHCGQTL